MRVFKFGGASIRDAEAIKNVAEIVKTYILPNNSIIMVVSALGKMTNQLELIANKTNEKDISTGLLVLDLISKHKNIAFELGMDQNSEIYSELELIGADLIRFIHENESTNFNYIYDQIVSQGEILSTTLVFHYFKSIGVNISFINAQKLIKTDTNYTDANIEWKKTEESIQSELKLVQANVIITQGFIGANAEMKYTTLGREGSDYTAAIIAKCTDTKELTIWKDVDGVYTADPKKFPEATIILQLSYKEAIEMTFYGAQIIHPKTIKPIQNSNCILKVKSFIDKDAPGTEIGNFVPEISYQPVIVHKSNQILYTFSVKDFSFLNETNLGKIIEAFGKYSLRINLMQNTAIEFCVATDEKLGKNELIVEDLKDDFDIKIFTYLEMLTIRHFNQEVMDKYTKGKKQVLAQKTDTTVQYLLK
jgi:aspartate kinase